MSIAMALTSFFGKALGTRLIAKLLSRPNGAQKLEQAASAMQQGMTAVEALKSVFGDDFLKAMDAVTGRSQSAFSYEAGIADYIKAETASPITKPNTDRKPTLTK